MLGGVFDQGQLKSAKNLGDQGTTDSSGNFVPNWLDAFKSGKIDGVVIVRVSSLHYFLKADPPIKVAGESSPSVNEGISKVEHIFGKSISQVLRVNANARPGKERGHEHFVRFGQPPRLLKNPDNAFLSRASSTVSPTPQSRPSPASFPARTR